MAGAAGSDGMLVGPDGDDGSRISACTFDSGTSAEYEDFAYLSDAADSPPPAPPKPGAEPWKAAGKAAMHGAAPMKPIKFASSGLVAFGGGMALWNATERKGYRFMRAVDHEECEQPPEVLTLPCLAWSPDDGKMVLSSMLHDDSGVFANIKFDEGSGQIVAVSHRHILIARFIMDQRPTQAGMALGMGTSFRKIRPFYKALHNPKHSTKFPRGMQPTWSGLFQPLKTSKARSKQMLKANRAVAMAASKEGAPMVQCTAMQHVAASVMLPGKAVVAYARQGSGAGKLRRQSVCTAALGVSTHRLGRLPKSSAAAKKPEQAAGTGKAGGAAAPKGGNPAAKGKSAAPRKPRVRKKSVALKESMALPVPMRMAQYLYQNEQMCASCAKLNITRHPDPQRSWTLAEIQRRFGATDDFARTWTATAQKMTIVVVAGMAATNPHAANLNRRLLKRAGSIVRGPAVYMVMNRIARTGFRRIRELICLFYADRLQIAAGVYASYRTQLGRENLQGLMSKLLRDEATSVIVAEYARFRFPTALPRAIDAHMRDQLTFQTDFCCYLRRKYTIKPNKTTRWVAFKNDNDEEESYAFVSYEMWAVLDAIRGGWEVRVNLAPNIKPAKMKPSPMKAEVRPSHGADEPEICSAPFPEVMCAEYITWWTLFRELQNRKLDVGSNDPTRCAPLILHGHWPSAATRPTVTLPGIDGQKVPVRTGFCFDELCRLALKYKFSTLKCTFSKYADFAQYPPADQDSVREALQAHKALLQIIRTDAKDGTAMYTEKNGVATVERVMMMVCDYKGL